MGVLIIIAIVFIGLIVLDLAAMRWGVDSREDRPREQGYFPPEHHY